MKKRLAVIMVLLTSLAASPAFAGGHDSSRFELSRDRSNCSAPLRGASEANDQLDGDLGCGSSKCKARRT